MSAEATTQIPEMNMPLAISVTVAGRKNVNLAKLVRQIIPILHEPFSVPQDERANLAEKLTTALCHLPDDEDDFPFNPCLKVLEEDPDHWVAGEVS